MTNLQDVLSRLRQFWTAEGCAEVWPCPFEIPGSTFHPELYRRLLLEDPARVCCPQPITRPRDGRAALHANRLARHLQWVVLLKPPPARVQDLFLRSLSAVGFALPEHDVRLTEWNWSSPSLDAWGVGWRAEIDGLGVARLTFVQEVAGEPLEPVALEVSYGIERLMQVLLDKKSVLALPWDGQDRSYDTERREDEVERSSYAQKVADPDALRRMIDLLCQEAVRCLETGAGRRAYELTAQSWVWLERLEARGAIRLPERQERIESLRKRIRAATEIWLRGTAPKTAEEWGLMKTSAVEGEYEAETSESEKSAFDTSESMGYGSDTSGSEASQTETSRDETSDHENSGAATSGENPEKMTDAEDAPVSSTTTTGPTTAESSTTESSTTASSSTDAAADEDVKAENSTVSTSPPEGSEQETEDALQKDEDGAEKPKVSKPQPKTKSSSRSTKSPSKARSSTPRKRTRRRRTKPKGEADG